ncbi:MAG: protein translocase subunit SecF, partial [Brevundimonas sp.]|uniref:protein translocase subunit SecF n=1 Tax=Brevundimonas sp. TaxID=1871086 RepID=UPI00271F45A2
SMEVSKPAGQVIELDRVRESVNNLNLGDVQVQGIARRDNNINDGSTAILRFQVPEGRDQTQVVNQVESAISQTVGEVQYSGVSVVGSKVSGELFTSGLLALAVAIGLMFLYIWFRFEPQFGFGAVIGLLHDVILTFGLIVLFRLEFSLNMVAAILTVIGYSMNDTVVVFDRLRENLRKYKTMPLREVIDLSLNETLSRTIITGVTAVMVLAALAVFGGEALFGFSIALMFGIIIGTYSSIYVGAPIILLWGVKRGALAEDAKPIKLGMASRP